MLRPKMRNSILPFPTEFEAKVPAGGWQWPGSLLDWVPWAFTPRRPWPRPARGVAPPRPQLDPCLPTTCFDRWMDRWYGPTFLGFRGFVSLERSLFAFALLLTGCPRFVRSQLSDSFPTFFVVFAPAGTQPSWASVRGVASPRVPAGFTRLGEPTRTPGQRDPGG